MKGLIARPPLQRIVREKPTSLTHQRYHLCSRQGAPLVANPAAMVAGEVPDRVYIEYSL